MLLLFASLILPAFVIQFMPEKVSEFYYREMTYAKIAADQEGSNKDETLRNLFEYVSRNIDVYRSTSENIAYSVVDINPFVDAIRGVGWCDQQAFLLMNLLNKLGIDKTRLRDVQAHTYSEVYIDNKWVILDPYSSLIFTDSNGAFLGIGELDKSRVSDLLGIRFENHDTYTFHITLAYILRKLKGDEIKKLIKTNSRLREIFIKNFPIIQIEKPVLCTFENMYEFKST